MKRSEAGLLEQDIVWLNNQVLVKGCRFGAFVDDAVSHRWDHLAEHSHVRAVRPQYVGGVDDQNSRLAAHRGKAIDAVQDRQPIQRSWPISLAPSMYVSSTSCSMAR